VEWAGGLRLRDEYLSGLEKDGGEGKEKEKAVWAVCEHIH